MRPVTFVAGAGEDGEIWADVLPLVTGLARVHELPGHGGREGPPLRTVERMTADLVGGLDGPTVLVGHSLGGAVILTAALTSPDLVAGLVLVTTGSALRVSPLLLDLLPHRFPEVVPRILAASTRNEAFAERSAAMMRRQGGEVLGVDFQACDAYDVTARLEDVDLPVTVLAGSTDRMTSPRLAEALATALRAELVVIEGVGHLVPWEAPDRVAEAVARVRGLAA